MAGPGRDLHPNALFEAVGTEVRAPGPDTDDDVGRGTHRVDAHLSVAEVDERSNVATVVHLVHAYGFDRGVAQLIERIGDIDHQDLAAAKQSFHVLAKSKDRDALGRLVGANSFEGAHAVVERVTEYVRGRVLPVDQRSVHPDLLRGG